MKIKRKYWKMFREGHMSLAEAMSYGLLTEVDPNLSAEGFYGDDSLDVALDKMFQDAEAQSSGETELDATSFASEVARVVNNKENLLDLQGFIIRRALNYITKNYNLQKATDVKEILQGNFNLSDTTEDQYDEFAPNAKGAGPEVA